ncbi:MAG: protein kinase, partial [Gemmataceae bacterium]
MDGPNLGARQIFAEPDQHDLHYDAAWTFAHTQESDEQPATFTDLLRTLQDLRLLKPGQLDTLTRSVGKYSTSPQELTAALVRRGWLTEFQANKLLEGKGAQLTLGAYVILEPLGEGGMGHVLKARHPLLDRLAAIKVLRKDLVAEADTLQRFLREIKIASQFSKHPHLVQAFDAGPVVGTYFLAMEYIDGLDLHRLVQESGQLSVTQAGTYLWQAALGLQHAHEHGLIHRDIKPANLLVTPKPSLNDLGTLKILDLGLARLQPKGPGPGRTTLTLTIDGTVMMGTIDYQAPEQALDFHGADIRADIYSLGCTFYYLLTGEPPFGGGTLAQKLMRHQQAQPPNLAQLRADVPRELSEIALKMLAKRPADRFQTPGEVAETLARHLPVNRSGPVANASPRNGSFRVSLLRQGTGLTIRLARTAARGIWQTGKRRPRVVLGATASLALAAMLWWLIGPSAPHITSADPPIEELPPQTELAQLRSRAANPGANRLAIWRDILAFRVKNAGKPDAAAAAELQMQLPSLLDQLDATRIKRKVNMPPEAVAVIQLNRSTASQVKFSPDGHYLAVFGDNAGYELCLYDLADPEPKLLAKLTGHTAALRSAAFSPSGKLLASGSDDTSVRLWDLDADPPKALRVLHGHTKGITCLDFAPDGKTLASGSNDRTVRLWNLTTATPSAPTVLAIDGELNCVAYSPDGKTFATGSFDGGTAKLVKIWDLTASRPKLRNIVDTAIQVISISPDGNKVAAGNLNGGDVLLWDLTNPKPQSKKLGH